MALTVDAAGYLGQGKPLQILSDKGDSLACLYLKVTFDASYPTGGETLDLRPYFSTVGTVFVESLAANYKMIYDYTNRKILVYIEDGTSGVHAEVANTTDLSALTVGVFAFGVAAVDKV